MQNLKVAIFLAYKSIVRGHKATLALIIFIMSLSFVNLVFIASILSGIIESINKMVINNLTANVVIEPQEEPRRKDFILHARELREQIEQIPGVIATIRHYKLAATIAYDKDKNGKFKFVSGEIVGIDPEQERRVTGFSRTIVAGRYLERVGGNDILLGANLVGGYGGGGEINNLGGVEVGDKVSVTFSNGTARTYKVKGIFNTRFDLIDRLAFVTAKEAESILSVSNNASQILVKTDMASHKEEDYMNRIQAINPALKVRKWTDFLGPLGNISKSFDMITAVISAIGLAVAAITIFILIYINAVNKRRQIGILKAVGIKQNIIIWAYILQAFFYTICGIIIGSVLIFALLAPYFAKHPLPMAAFDVSMSLNPTRIIFSVFSLLFAGIVAGFIPACQVARANILKAIWGT